MATDLVSSSLGITSSTPIGNTVISPIEDIKSIATKKDADIINVVPKEDIKRDWTSEIQRLITDYSTATNGFRYDGFVGLSLLSTAGAYFSTMEGRGTDFLNAIKLGGADPLSVGGIMKLRAQSTGNSDIGTFLRNIVSYKKVILDTMLQFENVLMTKTKTESSNVYFSTTFPNIMASYGIKIVPLPRTIELRPAEFVMKTKSLNGMEIEFKFRPIEYEDRSRFIGSFALQPTFMPSVKITPFGQEALLAVKNLAKIALKCMVESTGPEGKQYYMAYQDLKEAWNQLKNRVEDSYFGNTGYKTHLQRIKVIKDNNDKLKIEGNFFRSNRLIEITKEEVLAPKHLRAIVHDRTYETPDTFKFSDYVKLLNVFPIIQRHYWQLNQTPIGFIADLKNEDARNTKGIETEVIEDVILKTNAGSMSGPQYGQLIKREATNEQDAYFSGLLYNFDKMLADPNIDISIKNNIKQILQIIVTCYSKPKKEAKDKDASTNRFFNVYTAGFNIMNHIFMNIAYHAAAPYKFHPASQSIYKLTMAQGEFSNLMKFEVYASLTNKKKFLNYSDNLWLFRNGRLVSTDLVKAESQVLRDIAKKEIMRCVNVLKRADDAIDDAWLYQMHEIYPKQSIDSIGVLGKVGYINAGLGSGQAGTVQLNHVNTAVMGQILDNVVDLVDEKGDFTDEANKIIELSGMFLEQTASCTYNVKIEHLDIIRSDIQGMDAIFYNKHGIYDFFPILHEKKLLNAMLYHEGLEEKLKRLPKDENEEMNTNKYNFAKAYYIREKMKALFLLGGALSKRWSPVISFMINAANADMDKINYDLKSTEIDITGFLTDTLSAFVSADSPIFATLSTIEKLPYLSIEDYFSIMGKQAGYDLTLDGKPFHRVSYGNLREYYLKYRDPMLFRHDFDWGMLKEINEKGFPVKDQQRASEMKILVGEGSILTPGMAIATRRVGEKTESVLCKIHGRISFIRAFNDKGACIEVYPGKLNDNTLKSNHEFLKIYLKELGMSKTVKIREVASDAEVFRSEVLKLPEIDQRLLLSYSTYSRKIRIINVKDTKMPVSGTVNYPTQDTYTFVPLEGEDYELWFNGMKYIALAEIALKREPEFKSLMMYEAITLLKDGEIEVTEGKNKTIRSLKTKYGEFYFDLLQQKYSVLFNNKMSNLYMKRTLQRNDSIVPGHVVTEQMAYGIDPGVQQMALEKQKGYVYVKPSFFTDFTMKEAKTNMGPMISASAQPSYEDETMQQFLENAENVSFTMAIPLSVSPTVGLGFKAVFNPNTFKILIANQLHKLTYLPIRYLTYDLEHACKFPWNARIQWDSKNKYNKPAKFEINLDNYGFYCLRKSITANPANRNNMTEKYDAAALQNVPKIYVVEAPPFKDISVADYKYSLNKNRENKDDYFVKMYETKIERQLRRPNRSSSLTRGSSTERKAFKEEARKEKWADIVDEEQEFEDLIEEAKILSSEEEEQKEKTTTEKAKELLTELIKQDAFKSKKRADKILEKVLSGDNDRRLQAKVEREKELEKKKNVQLPEVVDAPKREVEFLTQEEKEKRKTKKKKKTVTFNVNQASRDYEKKKNQFKKDEAYIQTPTWASRNQPTSKGDKLLQSMQFETAKEEIPEID